MKRDPMLSYYTERELAAYNAGYDSAMSGANTSNCDFRHFATKVLTRAWERGRDAGNHQRKLAEEAASKRRQKRHGTGSD